MASSVLSGQTVASDILYSSGGLTTGGAGIKCNAPATFKDSVVVSGVPSLPLVTAASNDLVLNGVTEVLIAPSATAPQTTPAVMQLQTTDGGTASFEMVWEQSDATKNLGGVALSVYSSLADVVADSVIVASLATPSVPYQLRKAGSAAGVSLAGAGFGAHPQITATDAIACPSITLNSQVVTWLAGGSIAAFAAGIAAAVASAPTPGVGFTLTGTVGAIYGWQVLYG